MMGFWRKSNDERGEIPAASSVPRGRVLVVEDDRTTRELVSQLLRRAGYEVTAVADGSEALTEVSRFSPQVIIVDLMLPSTEPGGGQFDGFGVLKWLDMRLSKAIPAIVLTCRQDEAARRLAASLGVSNYLTKPFKHQDLLDAVHDLLERSNPSPDPPAPAEPR